MIRLFLRKLIDAVGLGTLPPVSDYAINERPRRAVKVDENRSTKAKIHNGKTHRETVDDDGRIVTEIGQNRPKNASEVQIDKYDRACLDFVVGVKWKRDEARALIMKWHWINGHSAKQIETAHTDTNTNELERGYSERTAAEFVRAFYDADDEREKAGAKRLRSPRDTTDATANVIEW